MKKKITLIIAFLMFLHSYSQCKDIFVGKVYQFKNNDLFDANIFENNSLDYYIDIFFKDDFDKNNLSLRDVDNSRQKINNEVAVKAFNLKGLDSVYFYNKSNDLIGYGLYKEAEYYENMIESRFVAAYTHNIFDYSQKPYYVSNCKTNKKTTEWRKSENNNLENRIIKAYRINRNSIIKINHLTNSKGSITYSIISYNSPYLNSILVENNNGKMTKLHETGSDYILDDIFISAFSFNNKPIIIASLTLPESDYFENAPIFYDGEGYSFKKGNRSGFENTKGDFNGDGIIEYVFIKSPTISDDDYGKCIGNCECFLEFSNENISPIKIKNCIGGIPENLGDLNNNGTNEIGIQVNWWNSLGGHYNVYTYKNGNWQYLVEPISTHCPSCPENYKPIEKDIDIDGNVIIRYTEMTKNGDFTLKLKSIKVN